ncbi:MAG: hypothetical protein HZB26_19975 [Candidatus Hydrogenedentes bacterium]|nr:hypothetical protein [Candidatus Hydrogenedentota bacterium]
MNSRMIVAATTLLGIVITLTSGAALGDEATARRWVERLLFNPPQVDTSGVCAGKIGDLPDFEVTPPRAGVQLVRLSLPFAPAALPTGLSVIAHCDGAEVTPDLRVLTLHPGRPTSVRRALVTFPFEFKAVRPYHFTLTLGEEPQSPSSSLSCSDGACSIEFGQAQVSISSDSVVVNYKDGSKWSARLIAPQRAQPLAPVPELVESGQYYLWARILVPDEQWPHVIEFRLDSLGTIAIQAHVQRTAAGDATAPDLGWEIEGPALPETPKHSFSDGAPFTLLSQDKSRALAFPLAPFDKRGAVTVTAKDQGSVVRFLRCSEDEKVPFQQAAWRRAAFVLGGPSQMDRNSLLEPVVSAKVSPQAFSSVYDIGSASDLTLWPILADLRRYNNEAIKRPVFNPGAPAGVFGMNRLNHCPAIFLEAWRAGDAELRNAAANWCSNMYDLSIWWGDTETYGGTRYNNSIAANQPEHKDDQAFMWRTNGDSNFCTKGYDSFFYAYEETGDPRMLTALNAQVEYARKYVHVDRGECRNIGDAADFIRLYRSTGTTMYRDEAMRLFRELRNKLSKGDLFSQGGEPILDDGPFIDDDAHGTPAPFAKPYIMGYALAGLPALLEEFPDEPKLHDVVRAVADFLARSQDPVGGWRYPAPASSGLIISQGLEHANQLVRASAVLERRGENIEKLLDAIERTLQARVLGFARTGRILAGLSGWEQAAGMFRDGKTIYALYKKHAARDPPRAMPTTRYARSWRAR